MKYILTVIFIFSVNLAQAYVLDNNTLTVGILNNNPPIAFKQNQQARGLAVDLAVMLSKSLNKDIVFRTGSLAELRRLLAEGRIDFICSVPPPFVANKNEVILTTSLSINRRILVYNPNIHITCEQDFEGQRLAILDGDPYTITSERSGAFISIYNNYNEAIQALILGEVDAFIAPSGEVASYIIQQKKIVGINFMGLSLERTPLTIIMNESGTSLFANISGALALFEESQIPVIREKWLGRLVFEDSAWLKYRNIVIYACVTVFLLLLTALVWSFFLKREVSRVTNSLRGSERRYRGLIEASPDLILLVNKYGQIFLANKIARETLNCNYDCHDGDDSLCMSLCDEGYLNLQDILSKARQGITARKEIIINSENKGRKSLEFIAFPADAANVSEHLICCIARDMTERKQMEKELVEVERLAVIGKMAAGVAHEVNNPLGIILANAEVLYEQESRPEALVHLNAIQRNVERAATIIKRLLHLSVPSDSSYFTVQNINEIIQETLLFIKPKLKNVTITVQNLNDQFLILGDKGTLEQLFINLILNALESVKDSGKISIVGQIQYEENDGGTIQLAFTDNGEGIDNKNLDRIFDIFYTTRGVHGFGLGLFISRRIAEHHGGLLYAESELGKWTTMKLEFPLYTEKEQNA